MKKSKKQIVVNGTLLRPLCVGQSALFYAGGKLYHTSQVTSIHEQSDDLVNFETINSNYYLTTSPFPLAAISPLPVSLAVCA